MGDETHTHQAAARDDSRCLLCGKSRQQVRKLILGVHGGVCIECVYLCLEIIESDAGQNPSVGESEGAAWRSGRRACGPE